MPQTMTPAKPGSNPIPAEQAQPSNAASGNAAWKYLEARPTSWKKQLFLKGRRVTAANIWFSMQVNKLTLEETAEDWDFPVELIEEAVRYCEANKDLIGQECDEEERFMRSKGIPLTPEERLCV